MSPTIPGVEIDSSGLITVNTLKYVGLNTFKILAKLGYQYYLYSNSFTFEVFDCRSYVSFPKLNTSYVGEMGYIFPFINATAESNRTADCAVDRSSYNLTSYYPYKTGV